MSLEISIDPPGSYIFNYGTDGTVNVPEKISIDSSIPFNSINRQNVLELLKFKEPANISKSGLKRYKAFIYKKATANMRRKLKRDRLKSQAKTTAKKKEKSKLMKIDATTVFQNNGPLVYIDLSFIPLLKFPELYSLIKQLVFIYGTIRRHERPLKFHLIGCKEANTFLSRFMAHSCYSKLTFIETVDARLHEIMEKESDQNRTKYIYLSPESKNILECVDPDHIYVIGGIVDHNRLKDQSYQYCLKHGIRTAKFPISKDYDRLILAVNHVFCILQDMANGGKFEEILGHYIPSRFFKKK